MTQVRVAICLGRTPGVLRPPSSTAEPVGIGSEAWAGRQWVIWAGHLAVLFPRGKVGIITVIVDSEKALVTTRARRGFGD